MSMSIFLPRPRRIALFGALVLAGPLTATAQQRPAQQRPVAASQVEIPRLPVERYTLPNGLTVLLSPDRSAPVVAVDIWYHVGSKNEMPGRTGFAHLFEHVMFQGSQNIAEEQHFKIVEESGGRINGSTSNDRTNYWEVVPSSDLETALWLEADRMGFLLPALTQQKLDGQRDVVKNERRQRVDNQVFGSQGEIIAAAIYPASHPYSWPVIGSMADLSAASLDDVKNFFRMYYAPNNATLAIVGDFDIPRTKQLVERYFGSIPRGPAIQRPTAAPVRLESEKRLVLEDPRARIPQLAMVWPTVGRSHRDDPALSALGQVLTQDRTSRLTKLLVYDRQLATGVSASQGSDELTGEFYIRVQPRANASLTEIERLVDSVLATVVAAAPTQREVDRFKNYLAVSAITGLQSVLGKAELLLEGQVFDGDPLAYVGSIRSALAVTPADVHRVARTYLGPNRVVLSMVPTGKLDMVSRTDRPFTNVTPASSGN